VYAADFASFYRYSLYFVIICVFFFESKLKFPGTMHIYKQHSRLNDSFLNETANLRKERRGVVYIDKFLSKNNLNLGKTSLSFSPSGLETCVEYSRCKVVRMKKLCSASRERRRRMDEMK